jgi:hypothetical protein
MLVYFLIGALGATGQKIDELEGGGLHDESQNKFL